MKRTPGFGFHLTHALAHVALLLLTAREDPRAGWSRSGREQDAGGLRVPPGDVGGIGSDVVPGTMCPMPVWQADPNIRYSGLVVLAAGGSDGAAERAMPCANPYHRSAAYP